MNLNQLEEIYKYNAAHGVNETNPVTADYHEEEREYIDFYELKKSDRIELERLRLLTDSGFPMYDVSYIYVIVNGKKAQLTDFPHQLPKRGFKKYMVQCCIDQGIFIKDLCNMSKISILR